jgi:hypothetical protein
MKIVTDHLLQSRIIFQIVTDHLLQSRIIFLMQAQKGCKKLSVGQWPCRMQTMVPMKD